MDRAHKRLAFEKQYFNAQRIEKPLNMSTRFFRQQDGKVYIVLGHECESIIVKLSNCLTNLRSARSPI